MITLHGVLANFSPAVGPPPPSYLLDTYTGAAAAYSLRQLRTGVTNVVRVRRSNDNAESDYTPSQIISGTLTAWTGANNGDATTWYDQTTNGINLTQTVAGDQRRLVNSGVVNLLNGKPSLGGVGKFFNGFSPGVSTVYTVVAVFKTPNITATWSVIRLNGNNNHLGGDQFGTRRAIVRAGSSYNPVFNNAYPNEAQNAAAHVRNNLVGKFYNNGVENANSPITAGGNGAQADGQSVGLEAPEVQEIIIWPTDQSANMAAIMADINSYYGIY
jgi:hypothetical protein